MLTAYDLSEAKYDQRAREYGNQLTETFRVVFRVLVVLYFYPSGVVYPCSQGEYVFGRDDGGSTAETHAGREVEEEYILHYFPQGRSETTAFPEMFSNVGSHPRSTLATSHKSKELGDGSCAIK